MSASAEQIAKVRRMTGEPTDVTYTDADVRGYIETYGLVDENGESPRVPSTTLPGQMMANPDWSPTYDLHAAAADIWEEKAALLAVDFDFDADGASFKRSQPYDQAMKQARYHRSRRNPKTIILVPDKARERTREINGGW